MPVSVNQMAGAIGTADGLVHSRPDGRDWNWSDKGAIDSASMVLDLAYDDVTAWGFAHARADSTTCATYFDSAGVMRTAAANVVRRTHDPVTLAPLGYLAEESSANGIRNSTMAGAAAGTPGTLPTNWANSAAGLSRQIVGTGTESGIAYVDVRLFGTTSGTAWAINAEFNNVIAASASQSWTGSIYVALVGGSTANISGSFLQTVHYTSGPSYISDTTQAITVTAGALPASRKTVTGTSPASTAFVQPQLAFTCSSGVAIDITLRIGAPQLEQKAFATSFIPTSSAAVTRAADSLVNTGLATAGWFNPIEGTMVVQAGYAVAGPVRGRIFSFDDGTSDNNIQIDRQNNGVLARGILIAGGVGTVTTNSIGSWPTGGLGKTVFAYKENDCAAVGPSGTLQIDTAATVPTGLTNANIGGVSGAAQPNMPIRKIWYYKTRLSNAQCQALIA